MRKLKLFSLLAGLLLSVGTMYADYPVVASGICGKNGGDNLTWQITDHGIGDLHQYWLTISGTGEMQDYSAGTFGRPWEAYKNEFLTRIIIESGVTTIGDYAFANLSKVDQLTIPEGVTSIGDFAFQNCTFVGSYEPLVLPASLETIGQSAFYNCYLQTVTFTTPSSLKTIDRSAFQRGYDLQTIEIPEGVTFIGPAAFNACTHLVSISLPSTLTKIGQFFINGCTKIETLEMKATTPPTILNEFNNINENLKIKCPSSAINEYANSQYWIDKWDYLYDASTGEHAPVPHGSGNCGKYGNNVTWDFSMIGSGNHLADYTGVLTLSGSGEMDDSYHLMSGGPFTPWYYLYTDYINKIDIQEGITTITGTTFMNTKNVKTYILPSTLTYIGPDAFFGCDNKEAVVYLAADPDNLTWWDNDSGLPIDPDDFLYWEPTPFGEEDIFHVQSTICYVPNHAYWKKSIVKWNKKNDYEHTNVNVKFAFGLNDRDDAHGIGLALNNMDGEEADVVTLTRPLNRDGYFATICLPFSLSAERLAYSSLAKAEIKEFTGATMDGGILNVEFSPVDHIEAGKPYFVKFTGDAIGDALDRLDFMNVWIDKTPPIEVIHGNLKMVGTYFPKAVEAQTDASDVLFLGPQNKLYWPSKAGNIKPFRAYFELVGSGALGAPKRGTPARIVERENAPTAIENVKNDALKFNKTVKNGMLVIEKNGVRYNAQGQIVK